MKGLFKFITLLLCVELIVQPIVPSISLGIESARAESCPAGFEWNSTLNRCLTSQQTSEVMNATSSCPRGDIACYKSNAETALKKAGAPDRVADKGGMFNKLGQFAAVAMPVTFAAIGTSATQAKCKSPSFYAMVAAGLALVAGDFMANRGHKSRLDEIKKDWGKIVNPTEAKGDKDKEREASINAQSEAFGMLARAEESLAKAAKMKKTAFTIAFYAYTASAAISTWEVVNEMMKKRKAKKFSESAAQAAAALTPSKPNVEAADKFFIATLAKTEATAKKRELEAQQAVVVAALPTNTVVTEASGEEASLLNVKANWMTAASASTAALAAVATGTAALTGPALKLAQEANTLAQNASKAVTDWVIYKQQTTCEPIGAKAPAPAPTGGSIEYKSQGLYSYYVNNIRPDIVADIKTEYDIMNSQDLASVMLNQSIYEGHSEFSPEKYQSYKEVLGELNNDPELIQLFKAASALIINNVNPFPSAFAKVEDQNQMIQNEMSDGGGGGGGTSSGSSSSGAPTSDSSTVNTNAAQSFEAEKGKAPIPWFAILGAGAYFTAKTSIGKKMVTSKARAIFSGIMAFMTNGMAKHAGEQAEAAEKRAELLKKMQADFNNASSALYACKSEDRNNPGMPNCYCYTAEGQRNQNRGNSQVCQKMWGQLSFKPGQYLGNDAVSTCIDKSRQLDSKCDCKKNNSCLSVSMPKISGFGAGNLGMMNQAVDDMNNINNGSVNTAQLDTAGIENKAARLRGLIKKLEDQKGMEGFKKDKDKMEKGMLASLQKSSAGAGSTGGGLGSLPMSNLPSSPAQAAQELEKELKYEPAGVSGGETFAPILNAGADEELEFGLSESGAAAQETAMADVMKQDLDYGANDMNGSNTNIFEVLSNRYQRSGMRRLFDEKGETKADEAAKSDINQ